MATKIVNIARARRDQRIHIRDVARELGVGLEEYSRIEAKNDCSQLDVNQVKVLARMLSLKPERIDPSFATKQSAEMLRMEALNSMLGINTRARLSRKRLEGQTWRASRRPMVF